MESANLDLEENKEIIKESYRTKSVVVKTYVEPT